MEFWVYVCLIVLASVCRNQPDSNETQHFYDIFKTYQKMATKTIDIVCVFEWILLTGVYTGRHQLNSLQFYDAIKSTCSILYAVRCISSVNFIVCVPRTTSHIIRKT